MGLICRLTVLLVPVQRKLQHDLVVAPKDSTCFAVDLAVCEEEGDREGWPWEDLAVAGEVFLWGASGGGVERHTATEEHAVYFASHFRWEAEEGQREVWREWNGCGDFGFRLCGKQRGKRWPCFRHASHVAINVSLELSNRG